MKDEKGDEMNRSSNSMIIAPLTHQSATLSMTAAVAVAPVA
jgi:hypothetical protein